MLVYDSRKGRRKPVGFARPARRRRKPAQGSPPNPAKVQDDPRLGPNTPKPAKRDKKHHKVQKVAAPQPKAPVHQNQPLTQHRHYGAEFVPQYPYAQPAWGLPLPRRSAIPEDMDDRASIVSAKLDDVLTAIDQGAFSGRKKDLKVNLSQLENALENQVRSVPPAASRVAPRKILPRSKALNPFAKVDLYANSRLPSNLPPLKLYLPAWPLICLAAQYSERAYEKPRGEEKHTHVTPDWKGKEKAMVIKSVPVDHMNVIVFAIRGTQSFREWATNFNANCASPANFIDDPGNFCHTGFLEVAKKILAPVASRLRKLLEDKPARSSCSLVMTGHSAGGAVAALLFCHMLSASATSELALLARRFKRIHCITFGAPPVSMLPLLKPSSWQHRKSLFLSFVNEGDPVTRADPAYVRSLLDLYMSPAPPKVSLPVNTQAEGKSGGPWKHFKIALSKSANQRAASSFCVGPIWQVPPCTYSNAGRIVVLRRDMDLSSDVVCAVTTTDEGLRGSVFGNPLMHTMKLYRERVEGLASRAITGGAWSA